MMQEAIADKGLDFVGTRERLRRVVKHTPLTLSHTLSWNFEY
jgi:hypothetical protein